MEQNRRDRYSYDSGNNNRDERQGRFDRQNEFNRDRDQFDQGNSNNSRGNEWNEQQDFGNQFRNQNFHSSEDFNNKSNWQEQSTERFNQGNSNYAQGNDDNFRTGRYNQNNQYGDRHQGNDRGFGNNQGFGNDRGYGNDYSQQNRGNNNFNEDRYRNQQGNNNQNRDWWNRTRDEVSSWFGDDDAERRRRQDRAEAGPHRGKGPREYSRSDERIREDVCDRLSDDDHVDASDIDIKVTGSEVILSGTVDSRETKRRAEDIAERVSGVSNVQNQLRVGQSAKQQQQPDTKNKSTGTGNAVKPEKIHHN